MRVHDKFGALFGVGVLALAATMVLVPGGPESEMRRLGFTFVCSKAIPITTPVYVWQGADRPPIITYQTHYPCVEGIWIRGSESVKDDDIEKYLTGM